jgi:hypothetical protein
MYLRGLERGKGDVLQFQLAALLRHDVRLSHERAIVDLGSGHDSESSEILSPREVVNFWADGRSRRVAKASFASLSMSTAVEMICDRMMVRSKASVAVSVSVVRFNKQVLDDVGNAAQSG